MLSRQRLGYFGPESLFQDQNEPTKNPLRVLRGSKKIRAICEIRAK